MNKLAYVFGQLFPTIKVTHNYDKNVFGCILGYFFYQTLPITLGVIGKGLYMYKSVGD
jgi:hypothetical protein